MLGQSWNRGRKRGSGGARGGGQMHDGRRQQYGRGHRNEFGRDYNREQRHHNESRLERQDFQDSGDFNEQQPDFGYDNYDSDRIHDERNYDENIDNYGAEKDLYDERRVPSSERSQRHYRDDVRDLDFANEAHGSNYHEEVHGPDYHENVRDRSYHGDTHDQNYTDEAREYDNRDIYHDAPDIENYRNEYRNIGEEFDGDRRDRHGGRPRGDRENRNRDDFRENRNRDDFRENRNRDDFRENQNRDDFRENQDRDDIRSDHRRSRDRQDRREFRDRQSHNESRNRSHGHEMDRLRNEEMLVTHDEGIENFGYENEIQENVEFMHEQANVYEQNVDEVWAEERPRDGYREQYENDIDRSKRDRHHDQREVRKSDRPSRSSSLSKNRHSDSRSRQIDSRNRQSASRQSDSRNMQSDFRNRQSDSRNRQDDKRNQSEKRDSHRQTDNRDRQRQTDNRDRQRQTDNRDRGRDDRKQSDSRKSLSNRDRSQHARSQSGGDRRQNQRSLKGENRHVRPEENKGDLPAMVGENIPFGIEGQVGGLIPPTANFVPGNQPGEVLVLIDPVTGIAMPLTTDAPPPEMMPHMPPTNLPINDSVPGFAHGIEPVTPAFNRGRGRNFNQRGRGNQRGGNNRRGGFDNKNSGLYKNKFVSNLRNKATAFKTQGNKMRGNFSNRGANLNRGKGTINIDTRNWKNRENTNLNRDAEKLTEKTVKSDSRKRPAGPNENVEEPVIKLPRNHQSEELFVSLIAKRRQELQSSKVTGQEQSAPEVGKSVANVMEYEKQGSVHSERKDKNSERIIKLQDIKEEKFRSQRTDIKGQKPEQNSERIIKLQDIQYEKDYSIKNRLGPKSVENADFLAHRDVSHTETYRGHGAEHLNLPDASYNAGSLIHSEDNSNDRLGPSVKDRLGPKYNDGQSYKEPYEQQRRDRINVRDRLGPPYGENQSSFDPNRKTEQVHSSQFGSNRANEPLHTRQSERDLGPRLFENQNQIRPDTRKLRRSLSPNQDQYQRDLPQSGQRDFGPRYFENQSQMGPDTKKLRRSLSPHQLERDLARAGLLPSEKLPVKERLGTRSGDVSGAGKGMFDTSSNSGKLRGPSRWSDANETVASDSMRKVEVFDTRASQKPSYDQSKWEATGRSQRRPQSLSPKRNDNQGRKNEIGTRNLEHRQPMEMKEYQSSSDQGRTVTLVSQQSNYPQRGRSSAEPDLKKPQQGRDFHKPEVKISPHTSAEVQRSPYRSSEVQRSSYGSAEVQKVPHRSADVQRSPYGSAEVQRSPYGSAEVQRSPHRSVEVQRSPHRSAEVQKSQYESADSKHTSHPLPKPVSFTIKQSDSNARGSTSSYQDDQKYSKSSESRISRSAERKPEDLYRDDQKYSKSSESRTSKSTERKLDEVYRDDQKYSKSSESRTSKSTEKKSDEMYRDDQKYSKGSESRSSKEMERKASDVYRKDQKHSESSESRTSKVLEKKPDALSTQKSQIKTLSSLLEVLQNKIVEDESRKRKIQEEQRKKEQEKQKPSREEPMDTTPSPTQPRQSAEIEKPSLQTVIKAIDPTIGTLLDRMKPRMSKTGAPIPSLLDGMDHLSKMSVDDKAKLAATLPKLAEVADPNKMSLADKIRLLRFIMDTKSDKDNAIQIIEESVQGCGLGLTLKYEVKEMQPVKNKLLFTGSLSLSDAFLARDVGYSKKDIKHGVYKQALNLLKNQTAAEIVGLKDPGEDVLRNEFIKNLVEEKQKEKEEDTGKEARFRKLVEYIRDCKKVPTCKTTFLENAIEFSGCNLQYHYDAKKISLPLGETVFFHKGTLIIEDVVVGMATGHKGKIAKARASQDAIEFLSTRSVRDILNGVRAKEEEKNSAPIFVDKDKLKMPLRKRIEGMVKLLQEADLVVDDKETIFDDAAKENWIIPVMVIKKPENPSSNKKHIYMCSLYLNNILVGEGYNETIEESEKMAYMNGCKLLLRMHPEQIISTRKKMLHADFSNPSIIDVKIKVNYQVISNTSDCNLAALKRLKFDHNQEGKTKDSIVILEHEDWSADRKGQAFSILNHSATQNGMFLHWLIQPAGGQMFKCAFNLQGDCVGEAVGPDKNTVKTLAAADALFHLYDTQDVIKITRWDDSKLWIQYWEIVAQAMKLAAEVGGDKEGQDKVSPQLKWIIQVCQQIIDDYMQKDSLEELIFGPGMPLMERSEVQRLAKRMELKHEMRQQEGNAYLVLSKKMTPQEMAACLHQNGGISGKYSLVPVTQLPKSSSIQQDIDKYKQPGYDKLLEDLVPTKKSKSEDRKKVPKTNKPHQTSVSAAKASTNQNTLQSKDSKPVIQAAKFVSKPTVVPPPISVTIPTLSTGTATISKSSTESSQPMIPGLSTSAASNQPSYQSIVLQAALKNVQPPISSATKSSIPYSGPVFVSTYQKPVTTLQQFVAPVSSVPRFSVPSSASISSQNILAGKFVFGSSQPATTLQQLYTQPQVTYSVTQNANLSSQPPSILTLQQPANATQNIGSLQPVQLPQTPLLLTPTAVQPPQNPQVLNQTLQVPHVQPPVVHAQPVPHVLAQAVPPPVATYQRMPFVQQAVPVVQSQVPQLQQSSVPLQSQAIRPNLLVPPPVSVAIPAPNFAVPPPNLQVVPPGLTASRPPPSLLISQPLQVQRPVFQPAITSHSLYSSGVMSQPQTVYTSSIGVASQPQTVYSSSLQSRFPEATRTDQSTTDKQQSSTQSNVHELLEKALRVFGDAPGLEGALNSIKEIAEGKIPTKTPVSVPDKSVTPDWGSFNQSVSGGISDTSVSLGGGILDSILKQRGKEVKQLPKPTILPQQENVGTITRPLNQQSIQYKNQNVQGPKPTEYSSELEKASMKQKQSMLGVSDLLSHMRKQKEKQVATAYEQFRETVVKPMMDKDQKSSEDALQDYQRFQTSAPKANFGGVKGILKQPNIMEQPNMREYGVHQAGESPMHPNPYKRKGILRPTPIADTQQQQLPRVEVFPQGKGRNELDLEANKPKPILKSILKNKASTDHSNQYPEDFNSRERDFGLKSSIVTSQQSTPYQYGRDMSGENYPGRPVQMPQSDSNLYQEHQPRPSVSQSFVSSYPDSDDDEFDTYTSDNYQRKPGGYQSQDRYQTNPPEVYHTKPQGTNQLMGQQNYQSYREKYQMKDQESYQVQKGYQRKDEEGFLANRPNSNQIDAVPKDFYRQKYLQMQESGFGKPDIREVGIGNRDPRTGPLSGVAQRQALGRTRRANQNSKNAKQEKMFNAYDFDSFAHTQSQLQSKGKGGKSPSKNKGTPAFSSYYSGVSQDSNNTNTTKSKDSKSECESKDESEEDGKAASHSLTLSETLKRLREGGDQSDKDQSEGQSDQDKGNTVDTSGGPRSMGPPFRGQPNAMGISSSVGREYGLPRFSYRGPPNTDSLYSLQYMDPLAKYTAESRAERKEKKF